MSFVIYNLASMERAGDESVLEAAERLLLKYALAHSPSQAAAARMLGLTNRVMNYKCNKYSLRPSDAWIHEDKE